MKLSIVPEIINSQDIVILDENDMPVEICRKSFHAFNYNSFKNPSIIIDIFETKRFEDLEIKRIELPQINRLGFRLVSIDLTSASRRNMRNHRGQKKSYMFKKISNPLEGAYEIIRLPKEHHLEMDILNKRIRIKGRNAYPYIINENASKWIEVEGDE